MNKVDQVCSESQPSWRNQRATVRYRCAPATLGKVVLDDCEFQRAWVVNLSEAGACLIVPRPLQAGCQITIHIKASTNNRRFQLTARVAHATQHPNREWVIGCELITKLTADELDELL